MKNFDSDERKNLLIQFGNIIDKFKPDFIFVENVPGFQKNSKNKYSPFPIFKNNLSKMGYYLAYGIVAAQDYGVAQIRRRFILLASKHGEITIPNPTHGKTQGRPFKTVRDAIGDLPAIAAGETYKGQKILNHSSASLSALSMERIKATNQDGGGRDTWPKDLLPSCYTQKNNGKTHLGHKDCYGRLWWDRDRRLD